MEKLRNYFYIIDRRQVVAERGEFIIANGIIKPVTGDFFVGQYIRIFGSIMNEGVFQIERVGDGYIDVSTHDEDYPAWAQPTGGHNAYPMGARVTHNGVRYVSMINANVTVPGTDMRYWEVVGEVEHSLTDEVFTGTIFPLAVPRDFLGLVRRIEEWQNRIESIPNHGIVASEGNQAGSISYATGSNGGAVSWASTFTQELNKYRMMRGR